MKEVVVKIFDDKLTLGREEALGINDLVKAAAFLSQIVVEMTQDGFYPKIRPPKFDAEKLAMFILEWIEEAYGEYYTVAPDDKESMMFAASASSLGSLAQRFESALLDSDPVEYRDYGNWTEEDLDA